jgi:hypothetical protein
MRLIKNLGYKIKRCAVNGESHSQASFYFRNKFSTKPEGLLAILAYNFRKILGNRINYYLKFFFVLYQNCPRSASSNNVRIVPNI